MKTIWKFQLAITDGPQIFAVPTGATIVGAGLQHERPTLWMEVDDEAKREGRAFQVHGTGHPIDHDGTYVGLCQDPGYPLVWHIYEL